MARTLPLYELDFRGEGIHVSLDERGGVTIHDQATLDAWDVMSGDGTPSTYRQLQAMLARYINPITWHRAAFVLAAHALAPFPVTQFETNFIRPPEGGDATANSVRLVNVVARAHLLPQVRVSIMEEWFARVYRAGDALIPFPHEYGDTLLRLSEGWESDHTAAVVYSGKKGLGVSSMSGMMLSGPKRPLRGVQRVLGAS